MSLPYNNRRTVALDLCGTFVTSLGLCDSEATELMDEKLDEGRDAGTFM